MFGPLTSENHPVRLAEALRDHLTESGFAFEGATASEATGAITGAVAAWAASQGWRAFYEAPFDYIGPPVFISGGCVVSTSQMSGRVDLRLRRALGPVSMPVTVEIDRTDDSTAVDKLRDDAVRGLPAIWLRWRGPTPAELPPGVARLSFRASATRGPVRYRLDTRTAPVELTYGGDITSTDLTAARERAEARRVYDEAWARERANRPPTIRC
ncbi:hypothetical protein ACWC5I_32600 [Kitasatospora sp. NPDC001574]